MTEKSVEQDGDVAGRRNVGGPKHDAILDAALHEFLNNGFSRAGMADIAARAGVSTATLYKHVRSKEDLFTAIIERTLAEVGDELDVSVFDLPMEDAIAAIARTYLKLQFDGGMNALMRVVIAEAPANPALGRDFVNRTVAPRQKMLTGYLDRLVASGELDIRDTALATKQLMGMFREMFIWPALFDPDFDPPANADAQIRTAARRFIELFGARRSDAPSTGTDAGA